MCNVVYPMTHWVNGPMGQLAKSNSHTNSQLTFHNGALSLSHVSTNHTTRRITDSFIELIDFIGGGTDVFQNPCPSLDALDCSLFQSPELLCLALPWAHVNLRIGDGHIQFKNIVCGPAIALFQNHIDAVWIAEVIHPGPFIDACGRDNECVAIPARGRVPPPSRQIRVHERLTSIGPDSAQAIAPFEVLVDPVRENNKFHG